MKLFLSAITKKQYSDVQTHDGHKNRHIGTIQLIIICIGCIMGAGIYMVSGLMIKEQAGPATIISFAIAGVLNVFYGLVYAEVGTRMPRSGSFYAFGYAVYGELTAFITGIFFIFSHIFGGATMNQALSFYIDSLCKSSISNYFSSLLTINSNYFMNYLTPLPVLIILSFSTLFLFNKENSKKIAIFLIALNGLVLLTVIVGGSRLTDTKNWKITFNSNSSIDISHRGKGGFAPYGMSGILMATIGAFFSLAGFDIVAVIAGDVINPVKTIPISICISLLVATLAYIATATVVSLMNPYYLTDSKAPFAAVFYNKGQFFLCYAISVGCICGIVSSLYGEILAGAQLVHSLMQDNLFPKLFYSNDGDTMVKRTCLISCVFIAIISVFISTKILIDITGLSLLLSIVILNLMVVNIRYSDKYSLSGNYDGVNLLSSKNRVKARILIAVPTIFSLMIAFLIKSENFNYKIYFTVITLASLISVTCLFKLWRMPMITDSDVFMTPFMPFLPAISNLFTFIILVHIRKESWILFLIFLSLCILAYLVSTFISIWKKGKNGEITYKAKENLRLVGDTKNYNSFN